jgi:hypothetical protein
MKTSVVPESKPARIRDHEDWERAILAVLHDQSPRTPAQIAEAAADYLSLTETERNIREPNSRSGTRLKYRNESAFGVVKLAQKGAIAMIGRERGRNLYGFKSGC